MPQVGIVNFGPGPYTSERGYRGEELAALLAELTGRPWEIMHTFDTPNPPPGNDRFPSDYARWLHDSGALTQIGAGQLDIVLAWSDDHGHFYEHVTHGPRWQVVNDTNLPDVGRTYSVLGLNIQRSTWEGLQQCLHSATHWAESCFIRLVPGEFRAWCGNWALHEHVPLNEVAPADLLAEYPAYAGTCHFPPGASRHYQYDGPDCAAWSGDHEQYLRRWWGMLRAEHDGWLDLLWD
ncbi:MAG: hypothetical protein CL878_01115 [Dehalococcoidia bacterium]|nr:hypothetical protein [Dehalococcoidia bacterium]